jgi:hypothetical protein
MSIRTQIFPFAAGGEARVGDGHALQRGLAFEASTLEGGEGCGGECGRTRCTSVGTGSVCAVSAQSTQAMRRREAGGADREV